MDDYVEYLHNLAQELGCGLRLAPDLDGMMYVEFGYVEGPDPYTSKYKTPQQCFAVGLHELGHFHHGHTQGRPPMGHLKHYFENGVLKSEAEAWDFALAHFDKRREEIEAPTRSFIVERSLGSYHQGAVLSNGRKDCRLGNGNRHHVAFAYDIPGALFNDVRSRLIAAV